MEKILLLEDDAANLQGIADVLRSEDYSVAAASNGSEAVEITMACGPMSIFITDMDLPNSSGTEIALRLLMLEPNIPVLFISGTPMVWWNRRDVCNFKQFPPTGVDFIEKPFAVSQLLMKVRSLIGQQAHIRIADKTQENQAA
jgi:two-component system cell cycle sensor histidine kinase/response regulator CckA